MNFKKLYNRLCCVMQWGIGFAEGSLEQIVRDKKMDLSFTWLTVNGSIKSIADPFLLKDEKGNLTLLYEDFSAIDVSQYGKLVLATLNKDYKVIFRKELLDAGSHASYPFVWQENNKTYIIPETSQQRKVSVYEYDFASKCLVNEKVIIDGIPLLDATIVKHDNKYWLFATVSKNEYDYSSLHIYYADSLLGEYLPHANNPVKNDINGSRSAGNIFKVDGDLYRPAQNCGLHYGESIAINKITSLSENSFSEELHFKITPDKNSDYNQGVHTINVVDGVIVIDGIKMLFRPFTKWLLFVKKKLGKS